MTPRTRAQSVITAASGTRFRSAVSEPEAKTLELNDQEARLVHALLQQSQFPEALHKMLAASVQTKLEDLLK